MHVHCIWIVLTLYGDIIKPSFISEYVFYTVQCTMYSEHCTMHSVKCTMYNVLYTRRFVYCTRYKVMNVVSRTSYTVQCTVINRTLCMAYSIKECTAYSVHRTLYDVHCRAYIVHYRKTSYSVQCSYIIHYLVLTYNEYDLLVHEIRIYISYKFLCKHHIITINT